VDDVYLGQILTTPYTFPPKGFAFCQGQVLQISQNTALFSLLGTTYGGNGTTTFALPDLRGATALSFGQGTGLSDYEIGQAGGAETVTLSITQIPAHTHVITPAITATARCKNGPGNAQSPVGNVPAMESIGVTATYSDAAPDSVMHPAAMVISGTPTMGANAGGQAHSNMQPSMTLN
jgi:microcystin-dependent protein